MRYVLVQGGLGNQMFQYAFMLALRHRGIDVQMDISYFNLMEMHNGYELKRVFGIGEPCIDKSGLHLLSLRAIAKFPVKRMMIKDDYDVNMNVFDTQTKFYWGYWQNSRYFKDIERELRKAFQFVEIDDGNAAIAQKMANCNSVSVHIRRGDYAAFGMKIIGDEYYSEALSYMKEKMPNAHYFVFSDDQNVARNIVEKIGIDYELIDWNKGVDSYKDMYLMSQCKHNIIANSSFSWWGAWLNGTSDKIIVAPKKWSDSIGPQPQEESWVLF